MMHEETDNNEKVYTKADKFQIISAKRDNFKLLNLSGLIEHLKLVYN